MVLILISSYLKVLHAFQCASFAQTTISPWPKGPGEKKSASFVGHGTQNLNVRYENKITILPVVKIIWIM